MILHCSSNKRLNLFSFLFGFKFFFDLELAIILGKQTQQLQKKDKIKYKSIFFLNVELKIKDTLKVNGC